MTGGYVRTNWRISNSKLKSNAIGAALVTGSFGGGAGANFPNGGFVMASFNGVFGATFLAYDAISVMNLFYGSNGAGAPLVGGTSGYKIIPVAGYVLSNHAASASLCRVWGTISTSDTSVLRLYLAQSTLSAGTSADCSAHIVWYGFIVSTP